MNGKYILRISHIISLSHPPIASRSSFPHTLQMVLARKILKRSTPMPMQPFVRIPPSSQPTRQKTGKPKARNMLHLVLLSNNGRPTSRRRLRRSKRVVARRTRMKTKMRMTNSWGDASPPSVLHAFSCHAPLWRRYMFIPTHERSYSSPLSIHDINRVSHYGNVLSMDRA